MNILYVALKYDYGQPERGYSFEHFNFYTSLQNMGYDIFYFDFMTMVQEHGRDWMNRYLLEVVQAEKPNLMFTVLALEDQLDPTVVRAISESTDTITLNWFCDDHYRFDNYSRHWAPCFNWVVTTDESALPKYGQIGYHNVIKSQWACNHHLYQKLDLPLKYDVTFVGQPHGNRRAIVQSLRNAGIQVRVWGHGWESGRLSQEKMIHVFNQSRINMNLANASCPIPPRKALEVKVARRCISRSLKFVPYGSQLKTTGKRWISKVRQSTSIAKTHDELNVAILQHPQQIKGRNFEVPGCGGFLLTERLENLGEYYEIGNEVVCFEDLDDLIEKARYYLRNDDERVKIGNAGYRRTLSEHTYAHRFNEIFQQLGLS
jgi:spore maturation protein CgeB